MLTFAKINWVTYMLPTTVAPVECILVTTVVLGSFSAALILLSFSPWTIFSSDFAAKRFLACVSQVKSALKYNCQKWHLNQSASWTGMWLGKQNFVFQNLPIWCHWYAKWPLTTSIALKICVHQDDTQSSNLCVKIKICNRPAVVRYQEHCMHIYNSLPAER